MWTTSSQIDSKVFGWKKIDRVSLQAVELPPTYPGAELRPISYQLQLVHLYLYLCPTVYNVCME